MRRFALCAFALILMICVVGIGPAAVRSQTDGDVSRHSARASDTERPRFSTSSFDEAQSSEVLTQGLRLLRSDETGLVLELQTPEYRLTPQTGASGVCDRLTVPDYALTDRVGWPQLPVRGVMVGVPPDADLSLIVLASETVSLPGRYDLCPVPRPVIEQQLSGELRYAGQVLERDSAAYAADRLTPSTVAEIAATGRLRSQRVAQLRLTPFQFNPATGELRHIRRLRVRLDFDRGKNMSLASEDMLLTEGPFETTLRNTLLNYASARAWRLPPELTAPQIYVHPQAFTEAYKVEVDQDGVYQITVADLMAAGVDVGSLDPRTFQMHNLGEEIALHVTGEADGAFDPGDQIRFYGQKTETRYTDVNVYWLRWGDTEGRRMAARDCTPGGAGVTPTTFTTTVRWEEDHKYQASIPSGEGGDHWFADYINTTAPTSKTYTLELHNLATTPHSATMRGMLYGYSHFGPTPDHHSRVYLNGHLVDDATWDGWREYQFEHDIPGSYLVEGLNEITVELPFDLGPDVINDIIFVNWFEIDYLDTHVAENDTLLFNESNAGTWAYQVSGFTTDTLHVLDVTSPTVPVRILSPTVETVNSTFTLRFQDTITAPHHYLALAAEQRLSPLRIERDMPSDLRATTPGADYIILTHGDFVTDVQPLADYRATQGLRTKIVNVQDIYDEFNDGVFHPAALRDFLTYTYEHWAPPAPTYVLLVGDGNYDFKDNFGFGEPNYVPPYLAYVDPWIGEAAADNRYVCVSGEDVLPDMHLGRLPAKTRAEASRMVNRILVYEQAPPPGDWRRTVLFVADNADNAGEFDDLSDDIADHFVPSPYVTQTIYYKVTHATVSEANADLIDAINEGRLLVNYIGHAAQQFWAFEHLFDLDDMAALTNTERLPFMVPMTCLDGYYIYPSPTGLDLSSLGESFVRAPGGGAIASWSPTGMGVSTGHDYLNKGLYEAIFSDGVIELGPATTQAKLYLAANGGGAHQELLDTYLLFGDPALRLNVLRTDMSLTQTMEPDGILYPSGMVTYTLAYTNAGPATAYRVAITDTLHPSLQNPQFTSSGATVTPRAGEPLAWDVEDLAPGTGGVITLTATLSPTFIGLLSNTATIDTTTVETVTLNNTATVTAGLLLEIERAGETPVLSWNGLDAAAHYRVYRDVNNPYFLPPDEGTLVADNLTAVTYSDLTPDMLGDPDNNYTYAVVAVDALGRASAPSTRVGEFDFSLVVGAAGGEGDYNLVALPLDVTASLPDADALASYLGSGVVNVLSWNPGTQTYRYWFPALSLGINFPLEVGGVYWLSLAGDAPDILTLVGSVPPPGSVRYAMTGSMLNCRYHDISLPLDRPDITSASELAQAVGDVELLLRWNPDTQTYVYLFPEAGVGTDFATRVGYPYQLCMKGSSTVWP